MHGWPAPVSKKGGEKARGGASADRVAGQSDGVCGCDVRGSEETVELSCCEGKALQSHPTRVRSRIGGAGATAATPAAPSALSCSFASGPFPGRSISAAAAAVATASALRTAP